MRSRASNSGFRGLGFRVQSRPSAFELPGAFEEHLEQDFNLWELLGNFWEPVFNFWDFWGNLGFRGLGFSGLGFRDLGFRV